ncbi:hypothetical protein ABRY94_00760 [Castellaniella ginsengisoli]|uniref:Uncharacterized protein n=1 Tax=Castellaniella ginsengisoli TaxID=546114 RepID=A0AB39EU19_9BURK
MVSGSAAFKILFSIAVECAQQSRRLVNADVLLVRHDVDCGYTYNGRAYSHILDSVAEILQRNNKNFLTVASPYSALIGHRAYGDPCSINFRYALATIKSRLLFGGDYVSSNVLEKKKVWRSLIESVSPKIIIGIAPGPDLCWAAQELDIPIYDFQHGTINDGHPVYKNILRDWPDKYVPSGFLCWDEIAAETLSWARERGKDVRIVGNPWFSRFINKFHDDKLVEESLRREGQGNDNKKTILVTLQWGLGESFQDPKYYKYISPSLVDLINETKFSINWLIRLHPVQYRSSRRETFQFLEEKFGKEGSVRWWLPTTQPLPQVLSECDLHITDSGSTTVEAAWFGIPTALLNDRFRVGGMLENYYKKERDLGFAQCVQQDKVSIYEWICRHHRLPSGTWKERDLINFLMTIK